MKKYTAIFLTVMFVLSVVLIAYAGREKVDYHGTIYLNNRQMPLPDAGDLRHHITVHMPYKKWVTWPGKGKMYKGKNPHGALLTTYVNDFAQKSIKKMKGMANNSIIVKENYAPDKKLMAVTVMYKVEGYNPDGGDWFWTKYSANFETLKSGKVKDCVNCHGTRKDNDYIFLNKVTRKGAAAGYGDAPGY